MSDYVSNYTGAEIDDAVGKASTIPQFTQSDANKVLAVNSTGNGFKYTTPASGGGTDLSNISTGQVRESSYVLTIDDGTLTWSSIIPSWGCGEVDCILGIAEDNAGGLAWTSRYPSYDGWGRDDHKVLALDYNDPDWGLAPVLFSNELASKVGQIPQLKQTIIHGYSGDTYEYSFEWVDSAVPSYSASDVSKILTIERVENYDANTQQTSYTYEPHWVEVIPDYNINDVGKILSVWNSGGDPSLVWTDASDLNTGGLPAYSTDDVGKTLQVQVAYIDNEAHYYADWSDSGLVPPSSVSGMGIVVQDSGINSVVDPASYLPMWLSAAWAGDNTDNVNSFLAVVPSGPDSTSLTWVEGQIAPLATASDLGKVLKVVSHTDYDDNTTYIPSWENISSILPSFTASDYGKTLSINWTGNGIKWADSLESILENMPSSSDIGNILYVIDCGGEPLLRWAEPNGYVFPDYSASDIGKTLTIVSDGYSGCQLAWV